MDSWSLVKENRFREAVNQLTEELLKSPSTGRYNNRGMAYLHLGEYDLALSDFRAAEENSIREAGGERDNAKVGVALWLSGEHQQAASVWTRGTEAMLDGAIKYTDAAGGVSIGNLLWFSAVRLGDATGCQLAIKLLKKKLRTKQSSSWPGPISRFLLGDVSPAQLRSTVGQVPILRERNLCQAEFYIGVAAFESNRQLYYESMRLAAELGSVSKLEAEYYLATYEAGRLDME